MKSQVEEVKSILNVTDTGASIVTTSILNDTNLGNIGKISTMLGDESEPMRILKDVQPLKNCAMVSSTHIVLLSIFIASLRFSLLEST